MAQIVIDAQRRHASTLSREVHELTAEGKDVVLILGENVRPERVLKVMRFTVDEYDVEIVVKHPELKDYITHAAAGATIGAGVGVAGTVLTAISLGNPITLSAVLAAAGLGALAGGLIGAATAPFSEVKVYRARGTTRLKFVAA